MKNIKLFLAIIIIVISIYIIWFSSKNTLSSQINIDLDLKITALNPFPEKKKADKIYLVVWWDIMLSRNVWLLNKQEGYDRIFWPWEYNPTNDFLKCKDDNCILFFNLESLFYHPDNDIKEWWFLFRANTGNIKTLLQLKWNKDMILSLSNNHTINWWYKWINITRSLLDYYNINYVWAGLDQDESRKISVLIKNNIKICAQAYSYDGQYVKVWEWKISWNKINEKDILEELQNMKFLDCDVKIIYLHWWSEYIVKPNNYQKNLATKLVEGWADLILWSHSHVPWTFTKINNKFVFYSFWNFIFDQNWWRNTKLKNMDYIYDHNLNKYTVPTYISLLWWFEITKDIDWLQINLDQIVMSEIKNWLHDNIHEGTYQEVYDRVNNIE